jgi:hypothetical protein
MLTTMIEQPTATRRILFARDMASAPDSLLLLAVNNAQEKQCRNDSEGIKERGYAFFGTPACAGFFIDFATYKTNHENRYDQN